MKTRAGRWLVVALCWTALAGLQAQPAPYVWRLPPGFPTPRVPADNPMSAPKVELGRHLFYDTRLSSNRRFSCATCHQQARAFADDKPQAVGVTGQIHPRGAMSLTNVAYGPVLTWANPTVRRLETQALVPMFGDAPVEMGLKGKESELIARLRAEPRYRQMFPSSFPGERDPFTIANITKAIAAFERTLLSGRSPYDRYRTTFEMTAIPAAAHRGEELFFSDRVGCFNCHGGFNFTLAVDHEKKAPGEVEFHNTGLYNVDGRGGYPRPNTGVHAVTGNPLDMGRFKPPTLRNIALTAPYMHDGSLRTLEEVLAHYEAGGRAITDGPHKGVGAISPRRSTLIEGFTLTGHERSDLIAFLRSLTDEAFTSDPAFSDPWRAAPIGVKVR
jgi:cytochrome c peroxidase